MRTLYGSTSWRRVLALVLVFVMMVSTMGTSGYSVFAEDLVETNEEVTVSEPEVVTPEVTVDDQGPSPGGEEAEEAAATVEATAESSEEAKPVEETVEDADDPAEDTADETVEAAESETPDVVTEPAAEDDENDGEPAADAEPVVELEEGGEPLVEETVKTEEPAVVSEGETVVSTAAESIISDDGSEATGDELTAEEFLANSEEAEAPAEPEEPAAVPEEENAESEVAPEDSVIPDVLQQVMDVLAQEGEVALEELSEEALAEEELLEEEEVEIPTHYEAELDGVLVVVDVPDGAFTEPVELRIKQLNERTRAYNEAEQALEEEDISYDGMIAFDISFYADGVKVEPDTTNGSVDVQMFIKTEELDVENIEDIDVESIQVTHISEEAVETVADTNPEETGFVEISEVEINEEVVEAIASEFTVDGFSTFTITWRNGGRTVTVHYVDTDGNELTIKNPDNTYPNLTEQSSSPAFLIYDIDGYEYAYTYRNTNTNANRIAPLLTKNDNNRWRYTGTGNVDWTEMSNGDNVYVVYSKKAPVTTGGTPVIEEATEDDWPQDAATPQFGKSSTKNGNGTNTISLSISGSEKPYEKSTKANVIVVFDRSGSMGGNNIWRLNTAKTAVNTMAETLLDGDITGVKMALVSFSTTASTVQEFTDDYDTYNSAVNGLTADGGTNWEQALSIANRMAVDSDSATYIVFVTDGDPTFRVSRGDVTNRNLPGDMWTGTTYQYYRNNHVFGQGNADDQGRNFDYAAEEVTSILANNKTFYAIGVSADVTKVQNLVDEAGGGTAYLATDSDALKEAFANITESIKSTLGFGDVEITDGITALTNAEMKVMQTVDPDSFKYYRTVNGVRTEWTTRESDGCAAASYADGAVHWDMGETFQLANGVTYEVEFVVWPSQAAYDLVADLNNGLKSYASLTNAEKAQVVELTAPTETTTGTYALKTNTDEVSATYNRTTKTGGTVSISDTTDVTAEYHEGFIQNMTLDSDYITVKKEWHNALDSRVVDGITLTVTKDRAPYLEDLELSEGNNWTSEKEYISAGFITKTADGRYNVREAGHDYTVVEPAEFSYYWDLTADVYRPMVVNGTLYMLIKTDKPTGTEGTDYFVIGGNNYQVGSTNPTLVAKNDRRSNLNLKKLVTANTQAVDKVPDPDDVFTYTITVTDINGDAVWFGAQDENGKTVNIESYSANVTPEIGADENPTGSYSVPSGAQFTISIKEGWNVRFFNLPTGSTYSIQETGMADGYEFVGAVTSAVVTKPEYADDFPATPGNVVGNTVTGTIDQPNNVYSTEYTNNWNPDNEIIIKKVDENNNGLAGARFTLYKLGDGDWKQVTTFTSKVDAGETLNVGRGFYKLEETTAPTNYEEVDPIYFEVKTQGNTTTVIFTNEDREDTTYSYATVFGNEITVSNTHAVGGLTVTKTVVSYNQEDKNREFEFTVTLNDTTVNGTYGGMTFTNGVATFKLKDGESAEATGLLTGIRYSVVETAVKGFITEKTGDSGTIGTQESTAAFTNTYSLKPTTVSFPVKKVLSVPEDLEGPATWSYTINVEAQNGAPEAATMSGTVSNTA
ncbi:MAG: VWA domain-containing protein, partial [Bacteroidaceae bacterium]|nr:VWA domain-containing protein [Bacteroidaceae bacterium]